MKRTQKDELSTRGTSKTFGMTGLGPRTELGKSVPPYADLERYLDFTVVDPNNDRVGTIDAIWEDHTGQPAYLGVKTGWLGLGRTHVIPVHSADVSEATRRVRRILATAAHSLIHVLERSFSLREPSDQGLSINAL